ncbi:MAG: carbon-nitrogen hydrolase [Deltaproteobacteria bacterium]|nr:carbon-nitrogen hydrolase [Deltaproteobacteria bacterium]
MQSLIIAVVQFEPSFGQKQNNLETIQNLTRQLEADIIVLPELCTSGYFFTSRSEVEKIAEPANHGPSADFFKDLARRCNAVVVAGFAERDHDRLYNSCLIQVPEKPLARIYRKTHLFYKERFCFDRGDTGFFVVQDKLRDVRIGPMICYDWRFPEAARVLTLLGADIIVCPSNLVTDAWSLVMPARAIENKVYVAVANRVGSEKRDAEELLFKGNSVVYSYNGSKLAKAGPHTEAVVRAEIYPARTRNKSFNPLNDILTDRQPEHYQRLIER